MVRHEMQQGLMLEISSLLITVFRVKRSQPGSHSARGLEPLASEEIGRMYKRDENWVVEGHMPDLPMGTILYAIDNMYEVRVPIGHKAYEYAEMYRQLEEVDASIISVCVSCSKMIVTFVTLMNRPDWSKVKLKLKKIHDDRSRREADAVSEGTGCKEPSGEPAVAGASGTDG